METPEVSENASRIDDVLEAGLESKTAHDSKRVQNGLRLRRDEDFGLPLFLKRKASRK